MTPSLKTQQNSLLLGRHTPTYSKKQRILHCKYDSKGKAMLSGSVDMEVGPHFQTICGEEWLERKTTKTTKVKIRDQRL